jgi:hypothetical protein
LLPDNVGPTYLAETYEVSISFSFHIET